MNTDDDIDDDFNDLINNLNIYSDVDVMNTINAMKNSLSMKHYDLLITFIVNNLDNEFFVVNFLDKLLSEAQFYSIQIQDDIMSYDLPVKALKNLLLLDNLSNIIYFYIFIIKKLSYDDKCDILEYIYNIGKLDDYIASNKKYTTFTTINKIKNNNVMENFRCCVSLFMKFHSNKDTFIKLSEYIDYFIQNILYVHINADNIIKYITPVNLNDVIMSNFQNTEYVKLLVDFFMIELDNLEIHFNEKLIHQHILFIKHINNIYKTETSNIIHILKPLIDKLCNLVYNKNNNIVNKHMRYLIYSDMMTILATTNIDYVPDNICEIILEFMAIDFLSWITIDEFITICEITSEILLMAERLEKIFGFKNKNYDDFLYNLLKIENEIISVVENQINKDMTYLNYTLIKNTIYEFINIINILTHFAGIYIYKMNEEMKFNKYGDLIYMFNLQINRYMELLENTNIDRYNTKSLLKHVMTSKFVIVNNQINETKYINIGLEYDKIIDYCINTKFSMLHDFIDNLKKLKQEFDHDNTYIDENSQDIDNLFYVKIKNKYKLPNHDDTFERDLLRLLIREKREDPYTRKQITLKELDDYNDLFP